MKPYNPPISLLRRALVASSVLAAGVVYAQTGSGASGQSGNAASGSTSSGTSSYYGSGASGSSAASNDSSMSSPSSSSDKLGWMDKRFVTKAADSGQEEVQIAQLAAQKATNPDVRQFAQQLVDQHTQVNSQLMTIASSKNVKLDPEDTTKDRTYKRLNKAAGNDFDREFVEHMIDEHEKDIKLFERAANNAKDTEVRQFASNTLPHLRQHLSDVQRLQQSIVPTGHDSNSWTSTNGGGSSGMSPASGAGRTGTTTSTSSTAWGASSGGSNSGTSTSSTGSMH